MKKFLQILFLFLLALVQGTILQAQNLVPNPSFEEYSSCPTWLTQTNKCVGWSININSADYYNSCASASNVGIPKNTNGFQFANTGNAYCGIVAYIRFSREYLGCELLTPLITGQKYYVNLKINASNYNYCFINKIGVLFTNTYFINTMIIQQPPPLINNFAHVYTSLIIKDTAKWSTIRGSFIADSSYKYLLIGNFFDISNFDSISYLGANCNAYYLVDDVCVSPDSLTCNPSTTVQSIVERKYFSIYPNPAKEVLHIKFNKVFNTDIFFANIINALGIKIKETYFKKENEIDITDLPSGFYIIRIYNNNNFLNQLSFVKL